MKKKLLITAITAIVVLSLAACASHKSASGSSGSSGADSGKADEMSINSYEIGIAPDGRALINFDVKNDTKNEVTVVSLKVETLDEEEKAIRTYTNDEEKGDAFVVQVEPGETGVEPVYFDGNDENIKSIRITEYTYLDKKGDSHTGTFSEPIVIPIG